MKKNSLLLILFFASLHLAKSQEQPIDVAEQTLKVGSKSAEELFYAFAEGDWIIFNFEEINGKELKEVEILEMPSNSRFKDYETASVKDKRFKVNQKSVFKFRFYNSALLKGRVCRVKIQRIPKDEPSQNFNTGIRWVEKFDTTYEVKSETITVGYDTIIKEKTRRVLASMDTHIVVLTDRVERVHSITNPNPNVSSITFKLPEKTYSPNMFNPDRTTEVVSWAYSISTGENGHVWYKNANTKASIRTASNLAVKAGLISSGYGALAILAVEGYSAFANPPQGENIKFQFYQNQYPLSHFGNSVAVSGRNVENKQGDFTLRLENDNFKDGINVDVKIIAITVTKVWADEKYTVQDQEKIKEKQTLKIPKVSIHKVPVPIEE